jgi:serine protease Do
MSKRWWQVGKRRASGGLCRALAASGRVGRLVVLGLMAHLAVGTLLAQPRSFRSDELAESHHKSGELTLRAFAPVAEAVREGVVQFERAGKRLALGTVVDANGWVLTKASEIAGNDAFTCRLPDGTEVPARVVTVNEHNDLALVRIEAADLRPVVWAEPEAMVGQWAVTPGLGAVPEAVGILSASPRRIHHRRAMIGVVLDLNRPEARIKELIAGLGAELAGLAVGDVVLAVNDSSVNTREGLVRALRPFREGQTVRLRVQRAEEEVEIDVEMRVPSPDPTTALLDRAQRMNRMGSDVSARADGFDEVLTHDTVLHAWQCGGPLLNLDGEAIGLNIARAGRVASYALPARLAREIAGELMPSGD